MIPGFPGFRLLPYVINNHIGQTVGFIPGQPIMEGICPYTSMHPAIPLAVVVLVANPRFKTTSLVRRNDVHGCAPIPLLETTQMPLSKVCGVKAVLIEDVSDSGYSLG